MRKSDVIVAGAGPVGLTASLALARAGAEVTLLEKRPGLSTASLASTIHPPTLEILDQLGVLAPVLDQGYQVETIQHRTPEGVFAQFAMHDLAGETPFPFRLHLEQSRITPVMLAQLRAHGAEIRFDHEVTGVEQDANGVTVTAAGQRFHAACLLAADGARSTIREHLGIAFEGEDYPDKILRIMTTDDLDRIVPGIDPVTYAYNGARSVSFLRMPDLWRIILRVPAEVTDAEAQDESWILDRFRAVLPGCEALPAVAGTDVYGASRRVAQHFRQGRVYLIGDAAHVTSTRGGMNMNCGIHDAAALAAALPCGTEAAHAVSDERRRVATEHLIPRTHRTVAFSQASLEALRATAADPAKARAYLRTAAMLDMLDRSRVWLATQKTAGENLAGID